MHRFLLLSLPLLLLTTSASLGQNAEVSRLAKLVASDDANAAVSAIDQLARFGEQAATATPELSTALSSGNADVRWHAARTLGAIGAKAESAIPALRKALGDDNPRVVAYSAYALGQIGEQARDAAPDLVKLVVSKDALVRRSSRDALRKIRAPREITLPLMVKTLEEANPADVIIALQTLAELGEDAVPVLQDALKDPRASYWACIVIADIGPKAKSAVPLVAEVLKNGEPECRVQAAVALGQIGSDANSAEGTLVDALLNDDFAGVRAAAAFALVKLNTKDEAAIAALKKARQSDDELLRVVSAWALVQLKPEDQAIVRESTAIVLQGLQSNNPKVRVTAARGLIESKAPRELVLPEMIAALQNANDELVIQIVEGLSALGPEAVPAVVGALKTPELRHLATLILNRIGPEAKDAVPALVDSLENPAADAESRREIQFALGGIGPAAAPAVPELIESLSSDNEEVRRSAVYALGKIGPPAKDAMPKLREMLSWTDRFDRVAAVWALLKIDLGNAQIRRAAVPLLIVALENERDLVRMEAAQALGEIGADAKSAVPALKKLSDDSSAHVRAAASEALIKIGE